MNIMLILYSILNTSDIHTGIHVVFPVSLCVGVCDLSHSIAKVLRRCQVQTHGHTRCETR